MAALTEVLLSHCSSCLIHNRCIGLLVAACVNIAPEGTFGAAIADVGVLDMLKVSLSSFLADSALMISPKLVQQVHYWQSMGSGLWEPR